MYRQITSLARGAQTVERVPDVQIGKEGVEGMNTLGKVVVIFAAFLILMLISGAIAGVFALFGASASLVTGVWIGASVTNIVGLIVQGTKTWRTM